MIIFGVIITLLNKLNKYLGRVTMNSMRKIGAYLLIQLESYGAMCLKAGYKDTFLARAIKLSLC